MVDDNNIYNSGLNSQDWVSLRDVMWPFIHAEDMKTITIKEVPEHLKNHPLIKCIKKYKQTEEDQYLDEAGQYLAPSKEPFGWYVLLTK